MTEVVLNLMWMFLYKTYLFVCIYFATFNLFVKFVMVSFVNPMKNKLLIVWKIELFHLIIVLRNTEQCKSDFRLY